MTAARWTWGTPLRRDNAVGSVVCFRFRHQDREGVIEFAGPPEAGQYVSLVRVRSQGRAFYFRVHHLDGEDKWLTGRMGRSTTRLWPGTHAEWRVQLAQIEQKLAKP